MLATAKSANWTTILHSARGLRSPLCSSSTKGWVRISRPLRCPPAAASHELHAGAWASRLCDRKARPGRWVWGSGALRHRPDRSGAPRILPPRRRNLAVLRRPLRRSGTRFAGRGQRRPPPRPTADPAAGRRKGYPRRGRRPAAAGGYLKACRSAFSTPSSSGSGVRPRCNARPARGTRPPSGRPRYRRCAF